MWCHLYVCPSKKQSGQFGLKKKTKFVHLLVAKFILSGELSWTFGTSEGPLTGVKHFVAGNMLRPRELFTANVARMVVMLLRRSEIQNKT